METTAPSTKERLVPEVAFGIAVIRGISTISIGLLLIFYPEKSRVILGNMMGFFWLISGVALLRRSKNDSLVQMVGSRTTRIIAIVGVLAGLLVVTRSFSRQVVPEGTLIVLLGTVIMLTGVMHVMSEIRIGGVTKSRHRGLHFLLGIFEIVFGLTLVLSPLDRSPASYWIATIWALIFGVLVIGDAISQRAQAQKEAKPMSSESDASTETLTESETIEA